MPNHGTFVNDWTAGDIEEIFTLRGMLEGARTHHPEFTLKKLPNPYKRKQAAEESK